MAAATAALAFPYLIAFNLPPSATLFNQTAAFVGWGMFSLVCATSLNRSRLSSAIGLPAFIAALALLLFAALGAQVTAALPAPLAWSSREPFWLPRWRSSSR